MEPSLEIRLMALVSLFLNSCKLLSRRLLCPCQLLLQPRPLLLQPLQLLHGELLLRLFPLKLGPQVPVLLIPLLNLPLILSLPPSGR